jgi:alpha-glucosidase (family GH31 glycosyl hydrolase)
VTADYQSYFSQGVWYDLNNYTNTVTVDKDGGDLVTLQSSLTQTNVHLREGSIIAYQPNTGGWLTTTDFMKSARTQLIIGRSSDLQ